jgi:hypothetical protein
MKPILFQSTFCLALALLKRTGPAVEVPLSEREPGNVAVAVGGASEREPGNTVMATVEKPRKVLGGTD